jgi:hypothetical protein
MSLRPCLVTFPLALALVLPTLAAEPPAKDDAGWKDLFDGKSLDGWKAADFAGAGNVKAGDGAIVMEKGKVMTGVVYAKDDFPKTDYEVTLEGKKVEGDDFFCTTTFPVGDSHCSLVVGGWSGMVVGLSTIDGQDASANETRVNKEFKKDQWYRVRIRVSAKRIEAWIDGEKQVDLDTTDRKISLRAECKVCRPYGIATYQTTGMVRGVRLRPLTDADKKEIAETKPVKKEG